MIKAFVFGKFFPFHTGHEAMINFAFTKCDFLSVLICCDQKETITGEVRKKWIEKTFLHKKNIEIKVLNYDNKLLPNTSDASIEVSELWAAEFNKHFLGYDLLITSEPYGEMVADVLGIQHILFDLNREKNQISASIIRNDLFSNWKFLPQVVKSFFAIKVVVLGTESTGKTTLTEQLAKHFDCTLVSEAGRDLISDSNGFSFEDLLLVAEAHAKKIETASYGSHPLLIIDTDIHITQSYANFTFNRTLQIDQESYEINQADLYLYLNNDVPYFQDGTRLNKESRNLLDASHRKVLAENGIDFVEITGNWQTRLALAISRISTLIEAKHAIK